MCKAIEHHYAQLKLIAKMKESKMSETATATDEVTNASEHDYLLCISQRIIECERALNAVAETHSWQQILQLMTDNEREHHV